MQPTIHLSFFSLIFIGLIVIVVGLGALKLLSLLVNALMGRGKSKQPAKVGAWSGVMTALAVTAAMFVGLMLVAMLFYARTQSRPQPMVSGPYAQQSTQVTFEPGTQVTVEMARALQLAEAVEKEQAAKAEQILAEADQIAKVEPVAVLSATATDANANRTAEQAAFIEARKAELQQL
ncbi:MAG: hypothetical protein H7Z17_13905, partial [Fuerstia sp.]|nr:hypothetical protein [Fuerstiella sp.]